MANINAAVEEVTPNGGKSNSGLFWGYLPSTVRAAQNDTITITNVSEVIIANLRDTDDTLETMSYATNVITCTRSDNTNVLGAVLCKK